MRDAARAQQLREVLALLHRHRADQHRLASLVLVGDVVDHGVVLRRLGLVDHVGVVGAARVLVGGDGHHPELVRLAELRRLGRRRASHPGQLAVEPEVVLQRDRGQRLVLGLDLDVLLGLDGLVHALVVAPAGQDAAGELVDDEHLAALDDVLLVLAVELLGLERVLQVADQLRVHRLVEVVDAELVLDLLDGTFEHPDRALLLVDLVVDVADQPRHDAGELVVPLGGLVRGTADDERGARLVDEDGVDLVDDGVVVAALDELLGAPRHVVAQVVEAELVVGAVGDVARVHRPALLGPLVGQDDPDRQAQEAVHPAHPLGVAAGEVVVDGDDVHALAGQRVEVGGQHAGQGLALTGAHLGDVAQVQGRPAHDLDVEVALAQGAPRALAGHGERLDEQVVQALAVGDPLLERVGLGAQLGVRQRADVVLDRVDGVGDRPQPAQDLALAGAQEPGQDHVRYSLVDDRLARTLALRPGPGPEEAW